MQIYAFNRKHLKYMQLLDSLDSTCLQQCYVVKARYLAGVAVKYCFKQTVNYHINLKEECFVPPDKEQQGLLKVLAGLQRRDIHTCHAIRMVLLHT